LTFSILNHGTRYAVIQYEREGSIMRSIAWAGILTTAMCVGFVGSACAGVKVSVKKASYEITGKTGTALLEAMDRRGPKHGLLTRAIAQTRYSVNWNITWLERSGSCRVKTADALLSVTYTYPQLKNAISPQLRKRWARFMKGVIRHEETHGNIAQEMVTAAERSVSGLAVANDRSCRKAQAQVKKRVNAIYRQYERRQFLFDKKEHGDGGNVEGLILALKK
jgi:predicted secreted Zn-dependent protease